VFAEFARTGSAYGTVAAFVGRTFPLRAYGGVWDGQLRWGKLTHGRVLGLLTNPAYAGTYVYGRHRTQRTVRPDGTVSTTSPRIPRADWPIVLLDHHQGYITWQQFLDIEAKLTANCTHSGARPPREGEPLCQGAIGCGSCGNRIGTRYQGTFHRAYYDCMGHRDAARTTACRSIAASIVDTAVAALLLTTLTTAQVALALDAAEQVSVRHTRAHHAAELAVERARYEADRAERAFGQVEPENRLVARTLESRWETKLAALIEAEAALVATRDARPPLPGRAELETLAADLPRLWDAPTTSAKDRKRLLRTLISDITVLPDEGDGQARIGVRWHTGATDLITTARSAAPRTPAGAIELITRLGPALTDEELVTELAAARLLTGHRRPFDVKAVRWARHAYKIPAPRTVPFRDGEIGIDDMARILAVSYNAAYYWITHRRLPARQDRTGRWCIPWTPETEADCRRRIASSGHLNPAGQGARALTGTAREGEVSVQDAARRLGVHDYDVYYWIRTGRLTSRRTSTGRVAIPWNHTVEAGCRDWLAHPERFLRTGTGSRPLTTGTCDESELSVQQVASRLGVLPAAVAYQVRTGRLPARRGPTGRVIIPWNDQVESETRSQLARPKHPGPTGLGSHPLPETTLESGELSVQQVAARLSIRPGALYYTIARSRLNVHRDKGGRLSIPWTRENEAICHQLAAQTRPHTPKSQ
ncbi:recombinase family protein, partial [Streptomyces sp. H27-C3]|uniref:recombinase family protein n=1 Tax=Streptomyces sp. H27-C3 TaxID=3046305 RepID=UPI0024B8C625